MNHQRFEPLARHVTEVVSRRSSLAALSGAALAAGLVAPLTASAKDNKAKKAKKKAKKKCKRQRGQCEAAVQAFCPPPNGPSSGSVTADGNGPSNCVQRFSACCPFFSTCNAQQGVECLLKAFPGSAPPP
jgi:hypothetical protein